MTTIDKDKPVLVTGATGYVAGWLVRKLLEKGIRVHAAVRQPDNKEKTGPLRELARESGGEIQFFAADLLREGSYAEAMTGCQLVFHTASPFISVVADPKKELVEPALLGTRNVLNQADRTPSVKRVVLTSSCAAIYGDNIDLKETPGRIFTEEIWNTTSSLDHGAYAYSKVLAEREAWKIAERQSRWDLVVINPSLVFGPALNPRDVTSESFRIIRQFGDGSVKTGVPHLEIGVVDVRDVATAHFLAGFTPTAAGRHIVSGHNTSFMQMAATLRPRFGDQFPLPRKEVPKWLIWLFGPMINKTLTRKYVARNIGHPWRADNSKSRQSLGVTYRPLEETMNETFQQLADTVWNQ